MVLKSRVCFSGLGLTTQNKGLLTKDREYIHKLWEERVWQETHSPIRRARNRNLRGRRKTTHIQLGALQNREQEVRRDREEQLRRFPFISKEDRKEEGRIQADLQGLLANTQTQKPRELDILTQLELGPHKGHRYGTRSMTGIWLGEDMPCSNNGSGERVSLY